MLISRNCSEETCIDVLAPGRVPEVGDRRPPSSVPFLFRTSGNLTAKTRGPRYRRSSKVQGPPTYMLYAMSRKSALNSRFAFVEHSTKVNLLSLSFYLMAGCLFSRNRKKAMFLMPKFANTYFTEALRDSFAKFCHPVNIR